MKKDGCDWNGTFNILMNHIVQCSLIPVTCPNGCIDSNTNKKLILHRPDLESHLSNVCPIRKIICDYCDSSIQYNELNSHIELCDEFPITCPKRCYDDELQLRRIKRKLINFHLTKECPNKGVECPFAVHGCKVELTRDNLQHHMDNTLLEHLKYLNIAVNDKDAQINLLSKKLDNYEKLMQTMSARLDQLEFPSLTDKSGSVGNKVDSSNSPQFSEFSKMLNDKDREIRELTLEKQMADLTKKFSHNDEMMNEKITEIEGNALKHRKLLHTFSEHVLTPYVIWEIKNISKHIEDRSDIYSSLFFSQFYKFELNVVFNYDDNNHVGMYCFINKGEYDDCLVWPFVGSYYFTLLSQNGKDLDYTKYVNTSTKPDEIKVYNDKPRDARNNGWGLKRFVSLDNLVKPIYCVNDTIILKLMVKPKVSTV